MKRFLFRTGATLCALALANAAHAQHAALNTALAPSGSVRGSPFTGLTVFGDSLSDDGDIALASGLPRLTGTASLQKFTTNPGNVTVEEVAARLGLPLAPSLLGGGDYAYGGAGVLTNSPGTPAGVPTVSTQIAGFLAASPAADPQRLYSVWAGANDIFYHGAAALAGAGAAQAIAALPTGLPASTRAALSAQINAAAAAQVGVAQVESADQAAANVQAAAVQEVTLLGALHAAGARHMLVFNLPDIGATPQAQATDRAAPGAAAAFTQLTQAYNTTLAAGLQRIGTGIVPVNAYLLFQEVAANPAAFGFLNSTTPACTTSSSLTCTQFTLRAPGANVSYAYADGVHPTTGADRVLSGAVVAELTAPAYVSLLAEAPLAFSYTQRARVQDQMARDAADPAARTRAFASFDYQSQSFDREAYTPNTDNTGGAATVGVDYRVTSALTAGVALTYGDSFAHFSSDAFKFRTQEILGSVFGQYVYHGAGYVNGSLGFGGIDLRDIRRRIDLGVFQRAERADTDGDDVSINLTAGWWFGMQAYGADLRVSPYASAHYERVNVNGYREDAYDSTSMNFADQTREALVGEFGARAQATLRTAYGVLSPFVQLAYDHDGDASPRSLAAGLATLPGEFSMPGYAPAERWGSAEAGLTAQITPRISLTAAYTGRFSDDSQRYNAGNIGLSYTF